jgi:hypothetical protein
LDGYAEQLSEDRPDDIKMETAKIQRQTFPEVTRDRPAIENHR